MFSAAADFDFDLAFDLFEFDLDLFDLVGLDLFDSVDLDLFDSVDFVVAAAAGIDSIPYSSAAHLAQTKY